MNSLEQQLRVAKESYAKFDQAPPGPAQQSDIEEAGAWFADRFGQSIPEELIEFWRLSSGIEVSGFTLWAPKAWEGDYYMPGVVDTNELYGLEADVDDGSTTRCLIGQRDSVDHYLYNLDTRKWEAVDQFSMTDVFESFDTFAELAVTFLSESLDQEARSKEYHASNTSTSDTAASDDNV